MRGQGQGNCQNTQFRGHLDNIDYIAPFASDAPFDTRVVHRWSPLDLPSALSPSSWLLLSAGACSTWQAEVREPRNKGPSLVH